MANNNQDSDLPVYILSPPLSRRIKNASNIYQRTRRKYFWDSPYIRHRMRIHPHRSGLAPAERHPNQGSGNFGTMMTCQDGNCQRINLNTKFVLKPPLGQQFHMTKSRVHDWRPHGSQTRNISSQVLLYCYNLKKAVFQVCMLLFSFHPFSPTREVDHRQPCMLSSPPGKAQKNKQTRNSSHTTNITS